MNSVRHYVCIHYTRAPVLHLNKWEFRSKSSIKVTDRSQSYLNCASKRRVAFCSLETDKL